MGHTNSQATLWWARTFLSTSFKALLMSISPARSYAFLGHGVWLSLWQRKAAAVFWKLESRWTRSNWLCLYCLLNPKLKRGNLRQLNLQLTAPPKVWELGVSGIFGSSGENGAKKNLNNWFRVCLRYIEISDPTPVLAANTFPHFSWTLEGCFLWRVKEMLSVLEHGWHN